MKIETAVIPVAGEGTRIMPLTLHQPKAMVGIADKPVIHYLIEELVNSGIRTIAIVHRPQQKSIKRYIQRLQLEFSSQKVKTNLRLVTATKTKSSIDSLLYAKKIFRNKPFLYCTGDDLLDYKIPAAKVLMNIFDRYQCPIILFRQIPKKSAKNYAPLTAGKKLERGIYKILDWADIAESTGIQSNFSGAGRFIITPKVFPYFKKAKKILSKRKEISIIDVMGLYLRDGHVANGWLFPGKYFDCGSKIGVLKANVHHGLKLPQFQAELASFVKKIIYEK